MGYKKNDPCIEKAYDDERLFVLMARDPQAPEVILKWIAHSLGNQPDDKIREALECAIEMQNKGAMFRERKQDDDKRIAERKEKDEFKAWKKSKEAAGHATDAIAYALKGWKRSPVPGGGIINEKGPEVLTHEETKQRTDVIGFARNFANWLDSMGKNPPPIKSAAEEPHGFSHLLDQFIKSLPNR